MRSLEKMRHYQNLLVNSERTLEREPKPIYRNFSKQKTNLLPDNFEIVSSNQPQYPSIFFSGDIHHCMCNSGYVLSTLRVEQGRPYLDANLLRGQPCHTRVAIFVAAPSRRKDRGGIYEPAAIFYFILNIAPTRRFIGGSRPCFRTRFALYSLGINHGLK